MTYSASLQAKLMKSCQVSKFENWEKIWHFNILTSALDCGWATLFFGPQILTSGSFATSQAARMHISRIKRSIFFLKNTFFKKMHCRTFKVIFVSKVPQFCCMKWQNGGFRCPLLYQFCRFPHDFFPAIPSESILKNDNLIAPFPATLSSSVDKLLISQLLMINAGFLRKKLLN